MPDLLAPTTEPPLPDARIVPVILSGGSGTRLWPVSRESFPKQLWPLVSERTLIQETALRAPGPGFAPPIVVCNQEHRFLVAEQLRAAGIAERAHRAGAGRPQHRPGDRRRRAAGGGGGPRRGAVDDGGRSRDRRRAGAALALDAAAAAARAGRIVTFGMRPTAPETGYGYIERGDAAGRDAGRLRRRPLRREAGRRDRGARWSPSGRHLWNSGMFVFTARTLLEELAAPRARGAAAGAPGGGGAARRSRFHPPGRGGVRRRALISLDYAVAERTARAAVVPADIGWSDVGSWGALWELGAKDAAGNVALGDVLLEGASNCYVRSDGMLAAVVGLKDAVVVVTEDAVLAMHRDHAQDVKKVVDRLKAAGRSEAVAHNRAVSARGASTKA